MRPLKGLTKWEKRSAPFHTKKTWAKEESDQVAVFDNGASGGLKKLGPLGKQVRNTTYHRIIRVGTTRFSTFVCAYFRESRTCQDAPVKPTTDSQLKIVSQSSLMINDALEIIKM